MKRKISFLKTALVFLLLIGLFLVVNPVRGQTSPVESMTPANSSSIVKTSGYKNKKIL
jgi:hypothetical protein